MRLSTAHQRQRSGVNRVSCWGDKVQMQGLAPSAFGAQGLLVRQTLVTVLPQDERRRADFGG